MMNETQATSGPTQEVCFFNEPHAWSTHMGSHLPAVQVCMVCQTVNRKDIQVQIDNARAESYRDGYGKGETAGSEAAHEKLHHYITRIITDASNDLEKVREISDQKVAEARRIAYKQGLFAGIYRGAGVANEANEKAAAMNEVQAPVSESPKAPQASHKCADAILLHMHDGTDLVMKFSHPMAKNGWKLRKMNGVEVMVIGHGVPRRTIPLSNVKFFDLLTEDDL